MTFGSAPRLVLSLSATVVTVLMLTSCSRGSASAGDTSSTGAAASNNSSATRQVAPGQSATGQSATSTAASSAPAGPARSIDVCATIDAAKANQLSGQQITDAHPESGLASQEYGCGYSNDDSSVQVQLTVFEHDAKSSYNLLLSQSKNVTQVSGLGDKAFYDNDDTLYVLAGNNLVQVNGIEGADHCAALARPLLAAL